MANPSLQIGNSNWAIKKDNLLGYSSSGTRFFPIPITMTRASAGTRVNSSGLVETVELLGSDDVTDGNFPSGTTAWSFGTGWSLGTNKAERLVAASSTDLVQASVFPNLTSTFQISFDVEASAGSVRARLGQTNLAYVGQGSYVLYGVPTGNDQLKFQADSSFVGSITNISVKESTKNDLARVDYTGSTSSLLAEPQRTNLVIYSEDFSNAAWSKSSVGIDTSIGTNGINPNIAISPDGTLNSDRVNFLLQSDRDSGMYEIISASTGNSYTASVYLKGEGSNIGKTIKIRIKRVTGGSFVSVDADYVLTGEWVRLEMNPLTLSGANSNALLVFTSNDATSCLMYGCQVEEGSYPTSIIPTSGSTVTRVQDQYTKTGISDKINSAEGVLFVEMAALSNDETFRYISLTDGTGSNVIRLYFTTTSNSISYQVRFGGSLEVLSTVAVSDITNFNKIAVKWKLNDFAMWIGGVEVATDTSGQTPTGMNRLGFDSSGGGGPLFGKVKQLQVFKTALTDSELIALTT